MSIRSTSQLPAARRILLIKPSSLGDVVHALPVLAGLRKAYPEAHIAWLIGTGFAPLLTEHPLIDELIPFDRKRYGRLWRSPRSLRDFGQFLRHLRRSRFDLVVDLQGLFRSAFFARVTGAACRVGFANARELAPIFYTRRVPVPADDTHAVDNNLAVARALGIPVDPPEFPLPIDAQERAAFRAMLRDTAGRDIGPFTAVIIGTRWASKCWPAEHWATLLDTLAATDLPPCVLLGGPDDVPLAAEIKSRATTSPIDLVGRTTLRGLAAAIAESRLVLTPDSGPMHIAAALDKPLVAIFGPTNPVRTGPYSDRARVVRRPLECAPCYRRYCPLGHHNCLRQLAPDEVARAVAETYRQASDPLVKPLA